MEDCENDKGKDSPKEYDRKEAGLPDAKASAVSDTGHVLFFNRSWTIDTMT